MNRIIKIGIIVTLIILVFVSVLLWRLLGKPYYKLRLLGTEYVAASDELKYANEHLEEKLYLIKKYKKSKDVLLIGYGGGSRHTEDLYYYGIADKHKNVLLEPKFQFLLSTTNSKNEAIIFGRQYIKTGKEKVEYYKLNQGQFIAIIDDESN